ncbi:hypothetical protein [Pyxidicoccus caerfyrddinensis]|uniref:hypothetical protein n=1 Tax=Pyxidicoccus caerfyrddinensis TaxID=2709663 RepID=UPI0013DAE3F3|nr:hypothetical protein [Pyxidicoccus caerfyrddinensis]
MTSTFIARLCFPKEARSLFSGTTQQRGRHSEQLRRLESTRALSASSGCTRGIQAGHVGRGDAGLGFIQELDHLGIAQRDHLELCWSKFKSLLQHAEARTRDELDKAIAEAMTAITPQDALSWFRHCGYRAQPK